MAGRLYRYLWTAARAGVRVLPERLADGVLSVAAHAGDAYRRYRDWLPFTHRRLDFLTRAAQDLGYDVSGIGGEPSAAARAGSI